MKTAKQMIPAVGQNVRVAFEQIEIECIVTDVKQAYGRTRLLIQPVAGEGAQWVEETRLMRHSEPAVAVMGVN